MTAASLRHDLLVLLLKGAPADTRSMLAEQAREALAAHHARVPYTGPTPGLRNASA